MTMLRKPGTGTLAGIFVVLLGVLFLAGAAWSAKRTYALVTEGVHVDGTVIDVLSEQVIERPKNAPQRTVTRYRYMVEFRDGMDNRAEFKDSIVDSAINHKKGDTVPVLYLRDDAAGSATIDYGGENWVVPIMLAIFGLSFLGAGGFVLKGGA